MALPPGARLGHYEILAGIGAGGMGEIYRARDPRLDREVAIKVIAPALAGDAGVLARFEREAMSVARLSHANILAIHEFGHEAGTAFVVMELIDSETLRPASRLALFRHAGRSPTPCRSPAASQPRTRAASHIGISSPRT